MANLDEQAWKTLESTYVVNDRWLKVRADTLLAPDGKMISPWYVMEYPEWVNCVVIDEQDNIILLSHYRHGVRSRVTEIIGGVADTEKESPIDTIRRELQEEIGLVDSDINQTGVVYANPSNQDNKVHTFLSLGGMMNGTQHTEDGADFQIMKMPFEEFYKKVTDQNNSQVFQGLQIASIFYAFNFLKNTKNSSEQISRLRSFL